METKICGNCKLTLTVDDFYKTKEGKFSGRNCKSCNKLRSKKYKLENKDLVIQTRKTFYLNNKERIAESDRQYRQNNPEKIKLRNLNYRKNNSAKILSINQIYRKNYPEVSRAIEAKRRSKKLQARPTWLTEFQENEIKLIYKRAKDLEVIDGVKRHLDHIHPLQGELICGLHIPINLQILTESENCSKSNKFESYVHSDLELNNLKPWEII